MNRPDVVKNPDSGFYVILYRVLGARVDFGLVLAPILQSLRLF